LFKTCREVGAGIEEHAMNQSHPLM